MQRDLTDSATQRNIGVAFGHSLLALDNLQRGLHRDPPLSRCCWPALGANWEVLAKARSGCVRAEIVAGRSDHRVPLRPPQGTPRGRRVGGPELAAFVEGLDIGEDAKARLVALTPATYTGLADALVGGSSRSGAVPVETACSALRDSPRDVSARV